MNPILFTLGHFQIRWYSVLIALGLVIAYFGIMREAARFKMDKNFLINVIFWAVIFGILGARLYYVIFNFDYYSANPNEIVQIWKGGLAIHGAIIFGTVTTLIYCKKYKFSSLKVLDMFSPFLLLGQSIGRWGNFFNSEAYGTITTYERLKELHVPEFVIKGMYINGYYNLPTFYFESIWCLIGVIILLIIRRIKKIKKGQILSLYLMWYSFGRFFIEQYRTDSLLIGNLRVAELVSMLLFVTGLVLFIIMSLNKKEENLYNDVESR